MLLVVVAVCQCGLLLPSQRFAAAPVALAAAPAVAINTDYDPAPQYAYAYNIQDSLTGDYKSQQESRDGDVVKGIIYNAYYLFVRRIYFSYYLLHRIILCS